MYALGLGLAIATVAVELGILYRYDRLLLLFKKHTGVAIVFSVALSLVLGGLFSAGGVVVFFAAVTSTVVTSLVYKAGLIGLVKRASSAVRNVRQMRHQGRGW